MAFHRFYLSPERWSEEQPALDAADSHHGAEVLRLGMGDQVVIFDGRGNEAPAEIVEVTRKRIRLSLGITKPTAQPRCAITLAQAVPKGKNMDLVIQKGVELGVSAILPLLTERTVVRIEDAGDALRKQERWQSIAMEACKQSGQNWMPRVAPTQTLKEFLSHPPQVDLILIASLQPAARSIKEVLAEEQVKKGGLPRSVMILIGPEGDFTPAEMTMAHAAGALPVTLGPIILRTETAAIYCLSVLGHELF
jgi:16S rRNA (uracil1498-N3)-methyltransferase